MKILSVKGLRNRTRVKTINKNKFTVAALGERPPGSKKKENEIESRK